jgi:hypothetical protein
MCAQLDPSEQSALRTSVVPGLREGGAEVVEHPAEAAVAFPACVHLGVHQGADPARWHT